jgi:phosphatidylinositol 3-kinase
LYKQKKKKEKGRGEEMSGNEFRFFLSCDINLPVTFRIESLDGDTPVRPPAGLFLGLLSPLPPLFAL